MALLSQAETSWRVKYRKLSIQSYAGPALSQSCQSMTCVRHKHGINGMYWYSECPVSSIVNISCLCFQTEFVNNRGCLSGFLSRTQLLPSPTSTKVTNAEFNLFYCVFLSLLCECLFYQAMNSLLLTWFPRGHSDEQQQSTTHTLTLPLLSSLATHPYSVL